MSVLIGILATTVAASVPPVVVQSYPVPMMDVDGSSKFVAVVGDKGVVIRRCQHMVVKSANYLSCEVAMEQGNVHVLVPIVPNLVDVRGPWNYMQPGVYK